MPGGYIGTPNDYGPPYVKEIVDITVGTPSGNRKVLAGWVGTPQGNKQWYEAQSALAFTSAAATSHTSISIKWNSMTPAGKFSYNVYRNGVGVLSTGDTSYNDSGLAASTTYTYRVDAIRNGVVAATASIAVATQAAPYVPPPPPPTPPPVPPPPADVAFDIECFATSSAPYYWKDNQWRVRSDSETAAGTLAHGYLDSTWGLQKMTWNINVPWEVRVAKTLRVFVRVRMLRTYSPTSGSWAGLVVHHNPTQGVGSSQVFKQCHTIADYPGEKNAWLNTGPENQGPAMYGDYWIEVTNEAAPDRGIAIWSEFRHHGAQGFGLTSHQSDPYNKWFYGRMLGVNNWSGQYWFPAVKFIGTRAG